VQEVGVGDEVFGWSDTGAYAEHALATTVAAKPADLDWASAAALPVASEAAERVLGPLALTAGESLLVHGASGAVGTLAVQLAVTRGVRVIGTVGSDNVDHVTGLGATATLYGPGLVDRVRAVPNGVDAVFDVAGKGALEDSITLRGGTDRIVTIADFRARELGITVASGPGQRSATRLAAVAEAVAAGGVSVAVTTYPLEEAAEAHQVSDAGHVRGKLVLLVH
jgi:NADPH:quinone reductase-like Zn-dependent oxidoreductase